MKKKKCKKESNEKKEKISNDSFNKKNKYWKELSIQKKKIKIEYSK